MILINKFTPKIISEFLNKYDDIYEIPALKNISGSTSMHPDLACCLIEDTLISAPELYIFLKEKNFPSKILSGRKNPVTGYPNDIAYNAASIGNFLFCNKKCTDVQIIKISEKYKKNIIDTNQGYAKCSIAKVSEKAIITADVSIYKKAVKYGIDALLVSPGNIVLDGYDSGFIGGCSIRMPEKLIFTGDISNHPDYKRIVEFCDKHQTEVDYIKGFPLTDLGSPLYLQ